MRIAIAGKGGVGKSTLLWPLALSFHQKGYRTIAIDADSNPSLALAAGIEPTRVDGLPTLFERRELFASKDVTPDQVLERCSFRTPCEIPLITMARVRGAGQGCLCKAHKLVREVTDLLGREEQLIVLIDTTAGLEYLRRATVQFIETLLIVAEPYFRSLEAAARIKNLAEGLNIKHIYGVANKVRDKADENVILEYFSKCGIDGLAAIPFYEIISRDTSNSMGANNRFVAQIVARLEDDYRAHLLGNQFFTLSDKLLNHSNLDLSKRELLTMRQLGKKGHITMKQLAAHIEAALSTTTAVVDKLVTRKYVKRATDENDRRIVHVRLTQEGKEFLKDHLSASEAVVKSITDSLDKAEQLALIELMRKLHVN